MVFDGHRPSCWTRTPAALTALHGTAETKCEFGCGSASVCDPFFGTFGSTFELEAISKDVPAIGPVPEFRVAHFRTPPWRLRQTAPGAGHNPRGQSDIGRTLREIVSNKASGPPRSTHARTTQHLRTSPRYVTVAKVPSLAFLFRSRHEDPARFRFHCGSNLPSLPPGGEQSRRRRPRRRT